MERCGNCGALIADPNDSVDYEGEVFCSYECFEDYCEEFGIVP